MPEDIIINSNRNNIDTIMAPQNYSHKYDWKIVKMFCLKIYLIHQVNQYIKVIRKARKLLKLC